MRYEPVIIAGVRFPLSRNEYGSEGQEDHTEILSRKLKELGFIENSSRRMDHRTEDNEGELEREGIDSVRFLNDSGREERYALIFGTRGDINNYIGKLVLRESNCVDPIDLKTLEGALSEVQEKLPDARLYFITR
ncbi:MAG: hypothetical protein U9O94_09855 [Nanoarchaeota archaeon]|nr:hypothetical protein [Nanoarchaeota archaeon]